MRVKGTCEDRERCWQGQLPTTQWGKGVRGTGGPAKVWQRSRDSANFFVCLLVGWLNQPFIQRESDEIRVHWARCAGCCLPEECTALCSISPFCQRWPHSLSASPLHQSPGTKARQALTRLMTSRGSSCYSFFPRDK